MLKKVLIVTIILLALSALTLLSGRGLLPLFITTEGRTLTEGEIELAESVFGGSIDYEDVLVFNENYLPGQGVPMSPDGNVYYPQSTDSYMTDFSRGEIDQQGTFIHELTHVWQHQHGVNVYRKGLYLHALKVLRDSYNPYQLPAELPPSRTFADYNIEQQGDVVMHYFYLINGRRGTDDTTPISTYEDILPFLSN